MILLESSNVQDHQSDQILNSDGIWAVYYLGKPINIRTVNLLSDFPGPKYKKTSFGNPGHAINLCKKLNKKFFCDHFTVMSLSSGAQVYPNAKQN